MVSAVWLMLLCGFFVFSTPMAEWLWLAYLPLHWGCVSVGGVILIAGIVASVRGRRAALLSVCIAVLGISLFFTEGFYLGRLALFELRKERYETLLSEAQRTGEIPFGEGRIDEGPPTRYAFYWQRGVTDNWAGVVYDPTGNVERVNEIPGMDDLHGEEWSEVITLFGGHMYRCQHLEGAWYLCWFT
jgi:hypothetical protein